MKNNIENKNEANPEVLGPDDWQTYKEIRLKSLKTEPLAYGVSFEQDANISDQEWRARLSDQNKKVYVSKIGDKAVALAMSRVETAKNVEHLATIYSVFTDQDYRNLGIATKLLEKILHDLYEGKTVKVRLGVNVAEEGAIKLYEKLGFKKIALLEKEMKFGDIFYDQYHMEKIFEDKL